MENVVSIILAFSVVIVLVLQFAFLWIYARFYIKNFRQHRSDFPQVSVLVAARNEQRDLPKLLSSLEQLDYPLEKIQFLFADDNSQDETGKILKKWCADRENARLIQLESKDLFSKSPSPKANALAFLDEYVTGDYLFFTDADCEVPGNWIEEMVSCFAENTGILMGITQVCGESPLAQLQRIDWWFTLGLVKIASDLRLPTTGLGNNMVIRREAYESCGGFSAISDSLTEDLEISRAIQKKGFQIRFQLSENALVSTKAESRWISLFRQRKRWMSGVMTLPWFWKIALILQILYFPAWLYLLGILPLPGIVFGLIKALFQSQFLKQTAAKANQSLSTGFALLFDFYFVPLSLLTILYYFWPSATEWKSRRYS